MPTRPFIRIALVALSAQTLQSGAQDNPHGKAIDPAPLPKKVDFNRDIRPFFSSKCYQCHGADDKARKADLRLDKRDEALRDLGGYVAVKPGVPDGSEVMKRVLSKDEDEVMPPPKEGHPLEPREIELLKRWIADGASYAEHWAFMPPKRPAVEEARGQKSEIRNPIDVFVSQKLQEAGLALSPPADAPTLIRRLSLDLTGLPPTDQSHASHLSHESYSALVDHLLSSPAYGEHMARKWLDIARYADSAGYGSDPLRMNIWPYRDWVIGAFNRNMPYDQFTLEQLAGDLLPDATEDQLIATAFHRNTMTNTEGGTDDEEFRVAAVKDRVGITMQAWMGLTMNCAQCHTHKFDPIPHKEYYQFYSIFNQTEDTDKPDDYPTMPMPTAEQRGKMKQLNVEIAALEAQLKKPDEKALRSELAAWEKQMLKPVEWTVLKPESLNSKSQATLEAQPDGSIFGTGLYPAKDTYTVKTATSLTGITAFRIEALPDDRLPNKGPGRSSSGNFVLSEVTVSAATKPATSTKGRFVRIDLPGKQKIIQLAEVQVFCGDLNVALKGTATQSGNYADAEAKRAIDGKTEGEYAKGSVSHTAAADNPWWEVDLGSELELEKIVLWNRTDSGTGSRLNGARLSVLDEKRRPVFETAIAEAPKTSGTYALSNSRTLKLINGSADFSQGGFDAASAADGKSDTGWAVGGDLGQEHTAVFEVQLPLKSDKEQELTFTLAQNHGDQHNLGRFRISATTAPQPVRALSPAIRLIIAKAGKDRSTAERQQLLGYFTRISKLYASTQKQIETRRAALAAIKPTPVPVLRELASDKKRETRLLNKGNFLDPGVAVQPALLTSFHSAPKEKPTRITVAKWLISRDNPLTARVMVNRLWAQLFGAGIVETEEDFGTQGTLPTHPELLDWLAIEFMDSGWDIQHMLRLIVTSQTYRQSSKVTPERLQKDPRCRLLCRYPRRRLDAEGVRDQALALSGLLSHKIGGPSVYPPQPDGLWRAAFNGQRSWETSKGEDRYRRGIYTFWRRTVPYPSMATFDAPSRENVTIRRSPTNTPLHAFVTLNDPAYLETAQALGRRLIKEGGTTPEERARFGLELCLARPARAEQVAALTQLFGDELKRYQADTEAAKKLSTQPLGALPTGLDPAAAAAWTTVANVLLNMDGVLTKG